MARRLGVSEKAIRKGITHGRFLDSLGKDAAGRSVIVDAERAAEEWRDRSSRPAKGASDVARTAADAEDAGDRPTSGVFIAAKTLADAQRLNANERARKLRMENDLREGRLVEVHVAAREAFNAQRAIREAILNIPARIASELAAVTDPMTLHLRLDAALREALATAARTIREAPAEEAVAANG